MLERTRNQCLQIRNRRYPVEQWPSVIHEHSIKNAASPNKIHLEIGCGREAAELKRLASWFKWSCGMDLEISAQAPLGANWGVFQADGHHVPLASGSVDVVSMTDVVEHLADPTQVFRECARVLRPGGLLIVSTVNQWFPPIVLGRLLPHRLRQFINRIATDTALEDTFPAYYRANAKRRLVDSAKLAGFEVKAFEYLSHHPRYLMFSVMAYRFGVIAEGWIRRSERLRFLRHMLHGVFVRSESNIYP